MYQQIKSRIKEIAIGLLVIFPCIIARLFYIQVISHERYQKQATQKAFKYRIITPKRGGIYDCNGVVLAQTIPSYNIVQIPAKIKLKSIINLQNLLQDKQLSELLEKIANQWQICHVHTHQRLARQLELNAPKKYSALVKEFNKNYYKILPLHLTQKKLKLPYLKKYPYH